MKLTSIFSVSFLMPGRAAINVLIVLASLFGLAEVSVAHPLGNLRAKRAAPGEVWHGRKAHQQQRDDRYICRCSHAQLSGYEQSQAAKAGCGEHRCRQQTWMNDAGHGRPTNNPDFQVQQPPTCVMEYATDRPLNRYNIVHLPVLVCFFFPFIRFWVLIAFETALKACSASATGT